ncbi:type 1 glutamine amidotransferase [Egicoccus sp. AB-alg2]|uniref:type 1 glutamine amidotransferase n=1 Tax=Egicoccus sp. AB-alg2 TaxID=3242693 RepID=UPI00359CFABA
MRALFIQHDPGSQPGLVGRALAERGFELELLPIGGSIHDATYHGPFPRAREFDLLVPLGAIWSVYDHRAVGTWIQRELDLLREADREAVPVLGICFGGQALAAAHGGEVKAADQAEIGFTSVRTEAPQLVPPGPWMQWHHDVFTVPDGGEELARNEVGPQAFRLRRNLGLQFHPEVDADIVASWLEMGGAAAHADLQAATGADLDTLLAIAAAERERCERDVATLVDGFLAEVAGV